MTVKKMPEDFNGKNLGGKEKYRIGGADSEAEEVAALLSSKVSVAILKCIVERGRCTREDFTEIGGAEEVESALTALRDFGFIKVRKNTVILTKGRKTLAYVRELEEVMEN